MLFKVTRENREVFGDEKFSREVRQIGKTTGELKYSFRVCDDDGVWYFSGKASRDDSFIPLDYLGADYGCTYIEYKNAAGKWEML